MHTIVDTSAQPAIALNYNGDWSGDVVLIVGASRTYTVNAQDLLRGHVMPFSHGVPINLLCRAIAIAARAHALQQARAALDDLG